MFKKPNDSKNRRMIMKEREQVASNSLALALYVVCIADAEIFQYFQ
jgi:hypothetical protein